MYFFKSSDFIFYIDSDVSDTKKINNSNQSGCVVGTQNRIQTVTNEPKGTNLSNFVK